MATLSVILLVVQAAPAGDAGALGYQGNQHLESRELEAAATAYRAGLELYQDGRTTDNIYHGLQNNLGLVRHGQKDYGTARSAFAEAIATARTPEAATRSLYNAGNNAFSTQDLEAALQHYRQALLSDPDNEDARYNYEYVKRQQQQQQQRGDEGDEEQEQQPGQDREQQQQDQGQEQQENQDQQQQDAQPQEEQGSQQEEAQPQEEQGSQQEEAQPQQDQMSQAEAERILQALENEEKELLREVMQVEGRPRRVRKDW